MNLDEKFFEKPEEELIMELEQAYLTLKRSVYNEKNSMIFLKKKIADFEKEKRFLENEERKKFFKEFIKKVKEGDIEELIQKISYKKIIKNYKKNRIKEKLVQVANNYEDTSDLKKELEEIIKFQENTKEKEYTCNYVIDCDIELHILSVLWIKTVGYKLDKKIKKYSYGYRLECENEEEYEKLKKNNRKLFIRYIEQYQAWKNNGIKKIREIIEEGENAIAFNLDLEKFYYNIDHDKLKEKINKEDENISKNKLTEIIYKINSEYSKKVSEKLNEENNNKILPIGIYSSNILANFYLKDLDDEILKMSPYYYGRYVDDIFIVFKEYRKIIDRKDYLKKVVKEFDDIGEINELNFKTSLSLKREKLKMTFFDSEDKYIELNKLENDFLSRVSTFAFFPDEKEIEKLYQKVTLEEDDLKTNKYNISVYLAKILQIYSGINDKKRLVEKARKIAKELIDLFSGKNIYKYFPYYEKVFSFMVMNNLDEEILKFYKKIEKYFDNADNEDKEYLKEYLKLSLFFSCALNSKKALKSKKIEEIYSKNDLREELITIINSNMFNQNLILYPLINYLKIDIQENIEQLNFFENRFLDICSSKKLGLEEKKLYLSPRFIHFDEINNFILKKFIFEEKEFKYDYINESKKYFNNNYKMNINEELDEKLKNIIYTDYNNLDFYKVDKKILKDKVRLGVASFLIKDNFSKIFIEEQDLSFKKKERIFFILNEAKKYKVDMIIFSEIAIPYQWLKILYKFSRDNQILITGGLEYIYDKKLEYNSNIKRNVYNCLFTILPFKNNNYNSSLLKFRLKNFYSPSEKALIEENKYNVPQKDKIKYDIFSWKGLYFSSFNCFELSDISSREKMKNMIDLLIASVYNRDLYYFDNILKSSCRDLHVFIAQSNTSVYGDCEILQPASKEIMTLGMIKGGINDNLLIQDIDINELREFQMLTNEGQRGKKYKQTPPGIDSNIVKYRKENKLDEFLNKK